tara:strand:+ start:325 stop:435 length:111 start_codon:yes stop_codon:yes gene_type:complete
VFSFFLHFSSEMENNENQHGAWWTFQQQNTQDKIDQ